MKRTTIMLPPDLKTRAERQARALHISMGELIRRALEEELATDAGETDPFFSDRAVYEDEGPDDLAARHDDALYGKAS